jgi:hypothetical protein
MSAIARTPRTRATVRSAGRKRLSAIRYTPAIPIVLPSPANRSRRRARSTPFKIRPASIGGDMNLRRRPERATRTYGELGLAARLTIGAIAVGVAALSAEALVVVPERWENATRDCITQTTSTLSTQTPAVPGINARIGTVATASSRGQSVSLPLPATLHN